MEKKEDNNLGLIILSMPYYFHLTIAILSLITLILYYSKETTILLYITTIIDLLDFIFWFNYKKLVLLIITIPIFIYYMNNILIALSISILVTTICSFLITYIFNKLLNLIIRKCYRLRFKWDVAYKRLMRRVLFIEISSLRMLLFQQKARLR